MCHIFFRCPNPLDSGNTSILYMKDLPQNRHQRRFEIKAFQFMDMSTNKYLNEEVTKRTKTNRFVSFQIMC